MSTSSATEVDEARVDEEWSQQLPEVQSAEHTGCHSDHPALYRDTSWENLERPRTCKLSATLKKRSHNHYIPSCMKLGKINVSVGEVSVNLQEIADLVAEGSGADELSSAASNKIRDSQLDAHEMASLTTMLKEVRVAMTVQSGNAEPWHIVRHLHQLIEFDEWLHKCCLQRCAKYNNLFDLRQTFAQSYRSFSPSNLTTKKQMEIILQYYFRCFSGLSGQPEFCSKLVCPLVLDILDLDCKGERQSLAARYNTQVRVKMEPRTFTQSRTPNLHTESNP
uniref:DUF4806 domain-containing protein n=1 Tax=Macrostomum lignano TaxID=282301 RepID=A0A1I8HUY2_9PLAT